MVHFFESNITNGVLKLFDVETEVKIETNFKENSKE